MNPEVTARHFQLAENLKQRTEERLAKLQRFFDPILEARVVVTFERNRYDAEAIVVANGTRLTGNAVADSDRAALDLVLDKLEMQVRRHKDRLVRGRRKGGEPREREAVEAPAESDDEDLSAAFEESDTHGLIREEPGDWSVVMDVPEAVAQLRVSRREALGFTNRGTGRPALAFKRRDGLIGVVDVRLD
jgi:putative sigma-54 modulation protein